MKYSEFESWFKDISKINLDLNISLHNAKSLLCVNSEEEKRIINYGFFDYHSSQLIFIVVIQLSKIFDNSKNQKRNIHLLFNKIINEKLDIEFTERLLKNKDFEVYNKEKLVSRIKKMQLEIKKNKVIINKITSSRNKIYAHTDPEKTLVNVNWEELDKIINLSNRIYNEIYGGVNNSVTLFELVPGWSVKSIINKLLEKE